MKNKLYREDSNTTYDVTKTTTNNTMWRLHSKSQNKKTNQSDDLMERGMQSTDTSQPKLTVSIIFILIITVTLHNLLSSKKV